MSPPSRALTHILDQPALNRQGCMHRGPSRCGISPGLKCLQFELGILLGPTCFPAISVPLRASAKHLRHGIYWVRGGAQRVWEGESGGRPCLVKERFRKEYRHPALNVKLTTTRLKQVTI